MAGAPSAVTSVFRACTRWNAGLSRRARLLECTSFFGPRPHFSPLDTSSSSTTPLAPSDTVTLPSGSWAAEGMKTPVQRLRAAATSGALDDLLEVRRADLLLAFRDEDEVDGRLAARALDRVQGGEERRLRTLLVHGAAAHEDLAEAGLVHEGGVERRRRPLGGIDLLDVVHEVDADRPRRSRVEGGEDAGMAVGGHLRRGLEAGVLRHVHHELAALVHAAVLGGDRRQLHPLLEALEAFRVALLDLGLDAGERVRGLSLAERPASSAGKGEGGRRSRGRAEEIASGGFGHGAEAITGPRSEQRSYRRSRGRLPYRAMSSCLTTSTKRSVSPSTRKTIRSPEFIRASR